MFSLVETNRDKVKAAKAALDDIKGYVDEDPAVSAVVAMPSPASLAGEIVSFLAERLRVQLRAEGARHDLVAAVFGAAPDDDLVRLLARADALKSLVEGPDGPNLLTAYRRAANILRIEDRKTDLTRATPTPRCSARPRRSRSPKRSPEPRPLRASALRPRTSPAPWPNSQRCVRRSTRSSIASR
jgi:hypothetical protein